ncbi:putative toxin-antitoxin system toxin component, PIN family [Aromatoleum anaerobium]|uniref:Toxin-antitoxin system toxin component, PIN family n=1 Tax=Aromatoleum anaerobium TaxID=182180 RepID=A0ABX1PQB8_9RHOO|nr:putative toxin-antitoxin system toxin component, PIN family [Aromatoleum anaerobium]MCK0505886.1 putative toxin-antitoxin system toxin component, PIN family [Aromatoleum anaerobium]
MPDLPCPRVVLDTNTVMALWLFEDPALARLRDVIEGRHLTLVTRADALDELRHVLAYRQFGVDAERQAAILAGYTARVTLLADRGAPALADGPAQALPALPLCRDRDDQKFLEIARDGEASHLVSRDKALLKLNRHRLLRSLFAVLTPENFAQELASR